MVTVVVSVRAGGEFLHMQVPATMQTVAQRCWTTLRSPAEDPELRGLRDSRPEG